MDKILKEKLIKLAQKNQTQDDPSHDFQHVSTSFEFDPADWQKRKC